MPPMIDVDGVLANAKFGLDSGSGGMMGTARI